MKTNLLKININDDAPISEIKRELNQIIDFLNTAPKQKAVKKTSLKRWPHASFVEADQALVKPGSQKNILMLKIDFTQEMSIDNAREELSDIMNFLKLKLARDMNIKEWNNALFIELDPATMNCKQCESCGHWTTNIEGDNPITKLPHGQSYKGHTYCDECLKKVKT